MKTRGRHSTLVGFALGIILALMGCSSPQPPTGKNADKEPKPPELRVLSRLVGTWGTPTAQNPKAMKATWAVAGTYVQIDHEFAADLATMDLITWDKEKRVFRWWKHDSKGAVSQGEGAWDEASNTLTLTDKSNAESRYTYTVVGESLVWKLESKDKAGKFAANVSCDYKRVKE
jgi:hypothetical protein